MCYQIVRHSIKFISIYLMHGYIHRYMVSSLINSQYFSRKQYMYVVRAIVNPISPFISIFLALNVCVVSGIIIYYTQFQQYIYIYLQDYYQKSLDDGTYIRMSVPHLVYTKSVRVRVKCGCGCGAGENGSAGAVRVKM